MVYPNVLLHEWGLLRLAPGVTRKGTGLGKRIVRATPLRHVERALRERKKRRKAREGKRGTPAPMQRAQAGEIGKLSCK